MDTQFKEIFNHLPRNNSELRLPDFPYPRRPVRPSYSVGILSYAETLKLESVSPEDEFINRPPARPPKRGVPVTFVYDQSEFPTPPTKKKQQNKAKATASTSSSVTLANTNQTMDDLKTSILSEIRNEVKQMISKEIGGILEQCKDLIKQSLATFQTELQATIATAMQQGFQAQTSMYHHPMSSPQNPTVSYTGTQSPYATDPNAHNRRYGSHDINMSDPRNPGHPAENYDQT